MPSSSDTHTVAQHFAGREPVVKQTYGAILGAARRLGPFREEPKKSSIHLTRASAFAGVATRKAALILTVKSEIPRSGPRVIRSERLSASRWHVELRLQGPRDVDREVIAWLGQAYDLSG